jgi:hypothetical protein
MIKPKTAFGQHRLVHLIQNQKKSCIAPGKSDYLEGKVGSQVT